MLFWMYIYIMFNSEFLVREQVKIIPNMHKLRYYVSYVFARGTCRVENLTWREYDALTQWIGLRFCIGATRVQSFLLDPRRVNHQLKCLIVVHLLLQPVPINVRCWIYVSMGQDKRLVPAKTACSERFRENNAQNQYLLSV